MDEVEAIVARAERRAVDEWELEHLDPDSRDSLPDSEVMLVALVRRGFLVRSGVEVWLSDLSGRRYTRETYVREVRE